MPSRDLNKVEGVREGAHVALVAMRLGLWKIMAGVSVALPVFVVSIVRRDGHLVVTELHDMHPSALQPVATPFSRWYAP